VNGTLPAPTASGNAGNRLGHARGAQYQRPQGLHIEGDAFTQGEVADMLARWATVPGLGEPRLASSQATVTNGKTIISFAVDIPIDAQAQDVTTSSAAASSASSTAGGTP